MMYNRKTKGAVSVFLVIILVPCMLISSIFVDLGRVHLSKGLTASASELALNSLLSNYDADLAEWYGMIASCQTIEQFYEASAQFFLRTISSQGLSNDEILLISDYYTTLTNDDTIYDLIKAECQSSAGEMINEVNGANLAEPVFLKDHIVDFMKYRAPIELTTGLFAAFMDEDGNSKGGVSDFLESSANENLVEDKQEYYKAEGDLLSASFETYKELWSYYRSTRSNNLSNEKLSEDIKKLNGYKNSYKEINSYVITNLFGTTGLKKYTRVVESDFPVSNYTAEDVATKEVTDEKTGVTTYYMSNLGYSSCISNLEDAIEDFEKAIADFEEKAAPYITSDIGEGANQVNPIRWWITMHEAVGGNPTKKVRDCAEDLIEAYEYAQAVELCSPDKGVGATKANTVSTLVEQADSLLYKYLTSGVIKDDSTYHKAVSKLEEISSKNISKINASGLYVTVDGKSMSIPSALTTISGNVTSIYDTLKTHYDMICGIIDGEGKMTSLDELATLAGNYETSLNNWTTSAKTTTYNGKQTDLADADQTEIETLDKSALEINSQSVYDLKDRLVNIRDQLKSLMDQIEKMEYGGKKIKEIDSTDKLIKAAEKKVKNKDIPMVNSELNTYKSTSFSKLFEPETDVALDHLSDNAYNPNMDPTNPDPTDTPALFVHFYKKWGSPEYTKEQFDTAKAEEESAETERDNHINQEKDKAAKFRGDEKKNIKNDIYTYDASTAYSAGTGIISSIAGLVETIIDGNFTAIRDDIYVASYITEMFSYATHDYEGSYELLSDDVQKELDLKNFADKYSTVEGAADQEKTWLSTAPTDDYNKSLTNKMINAENNYAYLAEIEYILYGKSTSADNVKAAFGEIYAIRLILNTISGFMHFWGRGNNTGIMINGISDAISLAFAGIIPAAVIKAVLIPILAAVESCCDNQRLAAGFPVELFKAKPEDWWYSIESQYDKDGNRIKGYSAFFNLLTGEAVRTNGDEGITYSDYLTFFVYTALAGGGDVEEQTYSRIADVIQTNIQKLSGREDYSLRKARLYFTFDATVRVKPIMVTLPIYREYDTSSMSEATDWCTYKIHTVRGYS